MAAAGAEAVHVHARGPDGLEALDADSCGSVVAAVRSGCPGLPVGLTTGAWIEPDPERRLAWIRGWHDADLPDFCSVNFSEAGAADLCVALLERGMGVEAGLATVADARTLVASGLAGRCLRVLVEPQEEDPGAATRTAPAVEAELAAGGVEVPLVVHGQGAAAWPVLRFALERGHDLRIGLEDTLAGPDGSPARDNEQLVAEARRMIEAYSSSG